MKNKILIFFSLTFVFITSHAQQNNSAKTDTIIFKVCFYSCIDTLDLRQDKFISIQEVSFYKDSISNVLRYASGHFTKVNEALTRKKILIENGFLDAFVMAFKNNRRISISDALKGN